MSTPFKLKKSPLELWPFGKKARMKRKLKKWEKSISTKKVSGVSDEELMAHHEKTREYDDGDKGGKINLEGTKLSRWFHKNIYKGKRSHGV